MATELSQIRDPALVAVAEEVLLDRLRVDATPSSALLPTDITKVRRLARLTLAQADPAAFDERYNRAFARRQVTMQGDGDGMARLTLTHTSVDLESIHHRLTMLAIGLGATPWRQPVSASQIQQGLDALERQQTARTKAEILAIRDRIDEARLRRWQREQPGQDHLDVSAEDDDVLTAAAVQMMTD